LPAAAACATTHYYETTSDGFECKACNGAATAGGRNTSCTCPSDTPYNGGSANDGCGRLAEPGGEGFQLICDLREPCLAAAGEGPAFNCCHAHAVPLRPAACASGYAKTNATLKATCEGKRRGRENDFNCQAVGCQLQS
jgi:hypothetical protein